MKTSTTGSSWSGFKQRLLMIAVLAGLTGSQLGCGCECATVGAAVALATPIVLVAREAQEAHKTSLEIARLEAEQRSYGNPP